MCITDDAPVRLFPNLFIWVIVLKSNKEMSFKGRPCYAARIESKFLIWRVICVDECKELFRIIPLNV